jgi:hypothetical protein
MDVVRLVESKVLLVAEKILEVLEGGSDYLTFETKLKKELDGLGCEILKEVLEALDRKIRESEARKRSWVVVRKNDQKEILTPFGPLVFKRGYYRHKESKEYSYLVDKKVGITPHARVGVNLKAELTEACAAMSYEESTLQVSRHNPELKVSRQTVASCVKEFKTKEAMPSPTKRHVSVLYIEADEDHVKVRGRKGVQARLVYVHEGIEEYPRPHLKNVKYFTTVSKTPVEFWEEVGNYIANHYELSDIEKIYLSGDGANWIRTGQEYISGAIYILDKFHLAKYILKATAHMPELRVPIYQQIQALNKQGVLERLQEALEGAKKPAREKRIQDTIKYIENNWDGIEQSVKNPEVGCSAEGHVSHILSARLSSRPMAWSLKGVDNMAGMRALRANRESIYEHYLSTKKPSPVIVELNHEVRKELTRLKEKRLPGREYLNNVPLLNARSSFARMALKGLNDQKVI